MWLVGGTCGTFVDQNNICYFTIPSSLCSGIDLHIRFRYVTKSSPLLLQHSKCPV